MYLNFNPHSREFEFWLSLTLTWDVFKFIVHLFSFYYLKSWTLTWDVFKC